LLSNGAAGKGLGLMESADEIEDYGKDLIYRYRLVTGMVLDGMG
jgi:hypothetical protein